MQTATRDQISEIAAIERELAQVVHDAARKFGDSDLKQRLEQASSRHREHASQLLASGKAQASTAPRVADERAAMERRVQHAVGADGLLATLGHLEQEEQGRLSELLATGDLDDETAKRIRQQCDDIGEDIMLFLDGSTGFSPGVGDPRNTV